MATVAQIIHALPIGRENAISATQMEHLLGIQPGGTNNDKTRRAVVGCIHSDDIPIGSTPSDGYWLIDSDEEYNDVVENINSTIVNLRDKRDAITRGWERRRISKGTQNPWPK